MFRRRISPLSTPGILIAVLLLATGLPGIGAAPAHGFQGFCHTVSTARSDKGRVEICATNARPSSSYASYDPGMAADGNLKTAWLENQPGSGGGAWIEYVFASPRTIQAIQLVNGYTRSRTVFRANGRVRHARILADGIVIEELTLADSSKQQTFRLSQPTKARYLRLEIVDTFPGRKTEYVAITEFLVEFADTH